MPEAPEDIVRRMLNRCWEHGGMESIERIETLCRTCPFCGHLNEMHRLMYGCAECMATHEEWAERTRLDLEGETGNGQD